MSSIAYLNSKAQERVILSEMVKTIYDRCAEKGEEPSAEERSQMDGWSDQIRKLDSEISKLETGLQADRKFELVLNRAASAEEAVERRTLAAAAAPETPEPPKGLATAFTDSPAFTEYRGRGTSARFEVEDIFGLERRAEMEERALLTTANTHPPVGRWDGLPGPTATTPFLELINRERVSTGSFDFVTWPLATGVAKVAEGAAKPEVTIAPVVGTLSLDTYAGWVQLTRQALEDVPRIRATIEARLRQNLAQVLEAGAAAALVAATVPTSTATGLAGVREAAGTIQAAGYRPNAIALNPADFAAADVAIMEASNSGPSAFGNYWGLRPVPVPGIPAGSGYVADWSQAVTWFDRGTTDIYLTDSHVDNFIKNIFVILAEARAQFAATDVNAVVEVPLPVTPPVARSASSSK